jgi:hypothetical protein
MKLSQGQLWKKGKEFIRIVRLERLEVEYKSFASPDGKEGAKHVTSKKDFCRLLKQAHLLNPAKAERSRRGLRPTPQFPRKMVNQNAQISSYRLTGME